MKTTLYACAAFFAGCIAVAAAISGAALLTGHPLSEDGASVTVLLSVIGGVCGFMVFGAVIEGQT